MKVIVCTLLFSIFSISGNLAQNVAYQGSFEADSFWTTFEGDWTIEDANGKFTIHFADNFEAKKAPDLKIFLSKLPMEKIDGENAADRSNCILIAELKTYKGSVSVDIPAGVNPSDYQSIIVHCEKYAKLWGGSPLK